jgi:acetolactate synthase-1/2/3 large subunit
MTNRMTAAQLVCTIFSRLGIDCAFGMPGTQLIPVYSALKHSAIRTVLASDELAAAFMANGFYRASGRPALLITIPGPGFTYTLTGLAEAKHDSVALVHLLVRKQTPAGGQFGFQVIDQETIATPLVKAYLTVRGIHEIAPTLQQAVRVATTGQPGPVIVEIDVDLLPQAVPAEAADFTVGTGGTDKVEGLAAIGERLSASRRPILFLGQGAQGGSVAATALASALRCPVITTISGRGVVAEDHPSLVAPDFGIYGVAVVNELIEAADLVLAVGCRFSHNGTSGFKLKLPPEKLIHVDTDPGVQGQNYPASLSVCTDASSLLSQLYELIANGKRAAAWPADEIIKWRGRFLEELRRVRPHFPRAVECTPPEISYLFETLRKLLPRECTIVTDSGLHQILTRCYFPIFSSRGLVAPSDFQSMGYGIPAAIGAKLARPERPTVVITGDGGFAMTGMELLTMAREKTPLTVIIFNDGVLGLIREQQTDMSSDTFGTTLLNPDFELFAQSMGLDYFRLSDRVDDQLKAALASPRGSIVDIRLRQSSSRRFGHAKTLLGKSVKRNIRSWLPDVITRLLKK